MITFTVDDAHYYCVPDEGPSFDSIVERVKLIQGVTVEKRRGFDSESAEITRGCESVCIYYDPMGGVFIKWPEIQPLSTLQIEVLRVLDAALAELH